MSAAHVWISSLLCFNMGQIIKTTFFKHFIMGRRRRIVFCDWKITDFFFHLGFFFWWDESSSSTTTVRLGFVSRCMSTVTPLFSCYIFPIRQKKKGHRLQLKNLSLELFCFIVLQVGWFLRDRIIFRIWRKKNNLSSRVFSLSS